MFINYDKLAEKILEKSKDKIQKKLEETLFDIIKFKTIEELMPELKEIDVTEIITSKLKELDINSVNFETSDYTGYGLSREYHQTNLKEFLVQKCAGKLVNDLYELRKLEVIKEIGTKEIIEKLDGLLAEKISEKIDKIVKE